MSQRPRRSQAHGEGGSPFEAAPRRLRARAVVGPTANNLKLAPVRECGKPGLTSPGHHTSFPSGSPLLSLSKNAKMTPSDGRPGFGASLWRLAPNASSRPSNKCFDNAEIYDRLKFRISRSFGGSPWGNSQAMRIGHGLTPRSRRSRRRGRENDQPRPATL